MRLAMDCVCLVEGECKQYKKSMGTAINIVGMEDIENLYCKLLTGKLHSQKKFISDLRSEPWYMFSLCFRPWAFNFTFKNQRFESLLLILSKSTD